MGKEKGTDVGISAQLCHRSETFDDKLVDGDLDYTEREPEDDGDPGFIQAVIVGSHQRRQSSNLPEGVATTLNASEKRRTEVSTTLMPDGSLLFEPARSIAKSDLHHLQDIPHIEQAKFEAIREDGQQIAEGTQQAYIYAKKRETTTRKIVGTTKIEVVKKSKDKEKSMIPIAMAIMSVRNLALQEKITPHVIEQNPQKAS